MTLIRSSLAVAVATAGLMMAAPALAQSTSCQDGQKILMERQSLVKQIQDLSGGGKKKQIDAKSACTIFTKLSANGDAGVKWIDANKDWCQIPDQFAQNFKQDHTRSVEMKGKACQAAAKMAEMEKKAAQAQKQGKTGGLLGGGGLTGTYSMPKGAL